MIQKYILKFHVPDAVIPIMPAVAAIGLKCHKKLSSCKNDANRILAFIVSNNLINTKFQMFSKIIFTLPAGV